MADILQVDICVIGAGSGGLSVAAGAAQMGASTVLIEKGKMGGDCLNYGCVPSKSLLAAGRSAEAVRHARRYGVNGSEPRVNFQAVHDHVHGVISAIAPHDSQERFEGMGVKVVRQAARFIGRQELLAGDVRIRARRYVIATGSSAMVPPIPGLADTPYFTNETVFDNTATPEHLLVIGGGPIGLEMAQAHCHLGSRVTVAEMFTILGQDDPELIEFVRNRVLADGIDVRESVKVVRVERVGTDGSERVAMHVERDSVLERIDGSHLLVAVGRKPNVEDLGLDEAGVECGPKGIVVDKGLRTTNRRIYAIGDVAGSYQFTHIAGYHAGIVLRNALFRLPAKVDYTAVPWVTYTTPELAHVGMTEEAARNAHADLRVLRWSFAENDRAQAERDTDGLVKVMTTKRGRVLGASIVGPHAGELLQPWILAITQNLKIGAMASHIAPYPTLSEANKRVAGSFYTPTLFSDRTRRLVRLLAKFG